MYENCAKESFFCLGIRSNQSSLSTSSCLGDKNCAIVIQVKMESEVYFIWSIAIEFDPVVDVYFNLWFTISKHALKFPELKPGDTTDNNFFPIHTPFMFIKSNHEKVKQGVIIYDKDHDLIQLNKSQTDVSFRLGVNTSFTDILSQQVFNIYNFESTAKIHFHQVAPAVHDDDSNHDVTTEEFDVNIYADRIRFTVIQLTKEPSELIYIPQNIILNEGLYGQAINIWRHKPPIVPTSIGPPTGPSDIISSETSKAKSKKWVWPLVGFIIGLIVVSILIFVVIYCVGEKKKGGKPTTTSPADLDEPIILFHKGSTKTESSKANSRRKSESEKMGGPASTVSGVSKLSVV